MKIKKIILFLLLAVFLFSLASLCFALPQQKTVSAGGGVKDKPQHNLIGQAVIGPVINAAKDIKGRLGGIYVFFAALKGKITIDQISFTSPLNFLIEYPKDKIISSLTTLKFRVACSRDIDKNKIKIEVKDPAGKTTLLNNLAKLTITGSAKEYLVSYAIDKAEELSHGTNTFTLYAENLKQPPALSTKEVVVVEVNNFIIPIVKYPPKISNVKVDNEKSSPSMQIKNRQPEVTFHIESPGGVGKITITTKDKNGKTKTYTLDDTNFINPAKKNGQVVESNVKFIFPEMLPAGPVEITIRLEPINPAVHGIAEEKITLETIGKAPIINNIFIDGLDYKKEKARLYPGEKLFVKANPRITYTITSESGIHENSLGLSAKGTTRTRSYSILRTKHWAQVAYLSPLIQIPKEINIDFAIDKSEGLENGSNTVALSASNDFGSVEEILEVEVATSADLDGEFLVWPNPFNTSKNNGFIEFHYKLTDDTAATIYVYNIAGEVMRKFDFASGANGGRQNFNNPNWNATTAGGEQLANGIYLAILRLENSGKQYKTKFTVF